MNRNRWNPEILGVLMATIGAEDLDDPNAAPMREALAAGLGSVILFGRNVPDRGTARRFCERIHALRAETIVAVDEEGGDVTRLQAVEGSDLPGAAALGACDETALTELAGERLGDVIASCDVDLDLAPVADVAVEPRNPVIGVRSFGPDPDLVARHTAAFTAGLHRAGVAACLKHFPGHGATTTDSHLEPARVDGTAEEILATHVAPFLAVAGGDAGPSGRLGSEGRSGWAGSEGRSSSDPAAAPEGAGDADMTPEAIMTAHVTVPALGEGPASISAWSTELLRGSGFEGVIVTDALDMKAVSLNPGYGEACVAALNSGADLLCLGSAGPGDDLRLLEDAHDAIAAALADGTVDPARLHEARGRVERLAERCQALRAARHPPEDPIAPLAALGGAIARRALVCRGDVDPGEAPVLLDLRHRADHAAGSIRATFADALAALRPALTVIAPPPHADPASWTAGEVTAAGAARRRPILLVRQALSDASEAAALAAGLDADPGAVVVHLGTASAAPECENLVVPHGTGRAGAVAAAARMVG